MANAHQQLVLEEDLISLDEVSMWSTEALKEYCRKREYKVSGSRAELCSRVYVLYNQQIPEQPGAKEKEASLRTDYKKLYQAGSISTDPHKLTKWMGEKEGMKTWPPTSFVDIVIFLNKHGHSLASETLTSYKTGKAYGYFYSDWLAEIFYHPIGKTSPHCYLKASCTPSNRLNDEPHKAWVKVDKQSGQVLSACCSCVAGLSQTCNHVAALLFKVESAFRLDISNPACTSSSCSWKAPSKNPVYMKLCDMQFKKPCHRKGKGKPNASTSMYKPVKMNESISMPDDSSHYQTFIDALRSELPKAVLFLPGELQSHSNDMELNVIDNGQRLGSADLMAAAQLCHSANELIEKIRLSPARITEVERLTVGQSDNHLWLRARKGRITASVFYRVYTKVETLKKRPSTQCDKLVDSILNPPFLGHIAHISTGSSLETVAVQKFVIELSDMGHHNITVNSCGLYIHQLYPYLGASPDGVVSCSCCAEKRLLEVKCPSSSINELTYLDDNNLLKKKSLYYGQVQGQLAVTGLAYSYFYVYTDKGSCCDMIKKDNKFCSNLFKNLQFFYTQYMAPAVLKAAHNSKGAV